MKRRDFLIASAGLPAALMFRDTLAATPCPPPSVSVAGGSSASSACSSDVAADWTARSTGPGVLWSHNFESEAEVARFTHAAADPSRVLWSPDGGPGGVGYVRCVNPAGVPANANTWERPLSAMPGDRGYTGTYRDFNRLSDYSYGAWPRGYYGHPDYWGANPGWFDGHEFYVQLRVRVTRGRWTTSHDGGKVIWFADLGYTPAHEIVGQALLDGRFVGYTNFGQSYITSSPQTTAPAGTPYRWQAGGEWNDSCTWVQGTAYPSVDKCWRWPGYFGRDQWVTFLVRLKLGHNNGGDYSKGQDTELDVWLAEDGATRYRALISRKNVSIPFTTTRAMGVNSLRLSAYFNGYIFKDAWEQDYAQIIFSKQFIPCPTV